MEEGAKIQAKVKAKEVICSGNFKGDIQATESILLHPPCVFEGTVSAPSLKIEEGVVFRGSSHMD